VTDAGLAMLVAGTLTIAACVDQPILIASPAGGPARSSLSALGIFRGPPARQDPVDGILPYDVNLNLYSDEAHKHRFIYVPPGTQIHATDDRWELPPGAILIKTFYYPADAREPTSPERLIETRFLVKQADGHLQAATYVWNDEQTDAFASGGDIDVPTTWIDEDGNARNDHFHIPGTSQCETCHHDRYLGLRTRQLDHDGTFADGTRNQIEHLVSVGVVDAPPPARGGLPSTFGDAPLADRARGYLDANCGHCHAADGIAASTHVYFDLEDLLSHPPICKPTPAIGGADRVIVPGDPAHSAFLQRMRAPDAFDRMPRGPTHIPDRKALAVLDEWIASLAPAGCP
jgi:uncharacterized repeat protein (TIGR03806 family)